MSANIKKINLAKLLRLDKVERQIIYIVTLAIFIFINLLISTVSLRFDLSYGKAYTLSSSTKKILKNLDDIVNIKFFASSDLPTRVIPIKNEVVDFISEYKKEGRGKINIKILDPKKDTKAQDEAKELGVPELQFSQLEQDKYAVTASYFAIVLSYGDGREILPQVTDLESLEYNLTAAIYKLTKKELPKIGIVGLDDTTDPREDQLASLKKIVRLQFDLGFADISSKSATSNIDSYKTIIVFGGDKKTYDNAEINKIKSYLDKKGKAIFFVDGVKVADNLTTEAVTHNLSNLLEEYGVKINNDLILSTSAELVNFGNETVSFFVPYPFWIKTNNFNPKLSSFSNIRELTYPWVSSLTLQKKSNYEQKEIVKSTKNSWEQTENFVLNPQNIPPPKGEDLKEFIISSQTKNKNGGEIIIIPTSRFVQERYLSREGGNLEFVINILNDLASAGALSGIRQRAVMFFPLPDIPEGEKDVFKYINVLLLPGLLTVYGGIRLMKRK